MKTYRYLFLAVVALAIFAIPANAQKTVSRFDNGLTNASVNSAFSELPILDRSKVKEFFTNFSTFNQHLSPNNAAGPVVALPTGDFILYATGSVRCTISSATKANMYISVDAVDNNCFDYEFRNMCFGQNAKATARMWWKCKVRIIGSTEGEFLIGVGASTAEFPKSASASVQNGIFFSKDDDTDRVDFIVVNDGTKTDVVNVDTKVNSSTLWVEYAFYYDGSKIKIYIDNVHVATAAATNLPKDDLMGPILAWRNGTTVAGGMYIAYISFVMEE